MVIIAFFNVVIAGFEATVGANEGVLGRGEIGISRSGSWFRFSDGLQTWVSITYSQRVLIIAVKSAQDFLRVAFARCVRLCSGYSRSAEFGVSATTAIRGVVNINTGARSS